MFELLMLYYHISVILMEKLSLFILWWGCKVSGLSMLFKGMWTGGAALGFKVRLLHRGGDLDFK